MPDLTPGHRIPLLVLDDLAAQRQHLIEFLPILGAQDRLPRQFAVAQASLHFVEGSDRIHAHDADHQGFQRAARLATDRLGAGVEQHGEQFVAELPLQVAPGGKLGKTTQGTGTDIPHLGVGAKGRFVVYQRLCIELGLAPLERIGRIDQFFAKEDQSLDIT